VWKDELLRQRPKELLAIIREKICVELRAIAEMLVDHALAYGWDNDLGGFYQDGTTHGNPDVHARQHNVSDESRIGVLEVGWHVDFGKPVQISDSAVDDQSPNVRGGHDVIKVIPDDDSVDLLAEEVNY